MTSVVRFNLSKIDHTDPSIFSGASLAEKYGGVVANGLGIHHSAIPSFDAAIELLSTYDNDVLPDFKSLKYPKHGLPVSSKCTHS